MKLIFNQTNRNNIGSFNMTAPKVIKITKDDGSPAYIRIEPRDGNSCQLYQTDQAGHLHFTTLGIAPEIGENTPALEDKDNDDHLGELLMPETGNSYTYNGHQLSASEQEQVKKQLFN